MKTLILVLLTIVGTAHADMPSTHGMLVFGDKATYASHLPMFHHPHDYQVVMKIEMSNGPRSFTMMDYGRLKNQGEKMFTIEPERMDLTKVMDGTIKSFNAILYQGHFERGGRRLGPVVVAVKTFLVKTKLDPAATEKNQYLLFGEQMDNYLVHLINGQPSFDLVAKTEQVSRGPVTITLPAKPTEGVIYHEENELH